MNKTASLPEGLLHIIVGKGTEPPFSGQYQNVKSAGTYVCRRCGVALFRAAQQFHSGCGWPSFDQPIADAVQSLLDADGRREEIVCRSCQAHLGHVFYGEQFTPLNTRHCVNAASLEWVPSLTVKNSEEAILAAGCFWV